MTHCPSVGFVILVASPELMSNYLIQSLVESDVRPAWLLENKELDACDGNVSDISVRSCRTAQHRSFKVRQTRCMWGKYVRHTLQCLSWIHVFCCFHASNIATLPANSTQVFAFWSKPTWWNKRSHQAPQKVMLKKHSHSHPVPGTNCLCRRRSWKGNTKIYGSCYLPEQSLAMKSLLLMFVLDTSFTHAAFIIKQLVTPRIGWQRQPRPSRSSSKTKGKGKEGQTDNKKTWIRNALLESCVRWRQQGRQGKLPEPGLRNKVS